MFWESLSLLSKILFCTGIGATAVLLVQIILMIIGFAGDAFGDGDLDIDADADTDVDLDDAGDGVGLFTIKGLVAFFSIGSWTGFAMDTAGCHEALSICVAVVAGAAALVGVGLLYKALNKLQSSGNLNMANAIGKTAEVYLTIPANNSGTGKVTLEVQEKFVEATARTTSQNSLPTGSIVKVVDVVNGELIVE